MGKSFESDGKAILLTFIGVIITVVMLLVVANQVYSTTNSFTATNLTVTAPADGEQLNLPGRELVGSVVCANGSNGGNGDCSGNYTFTDVISNGIKTIQMNTTVDGVNSGYAGIDVNLTYTYHPDGYLSSGSSRAVTSLTVLFGAIAIVIFVLVMFVSSGTLGKIIGKR